MKNNISHIIALIQEAIDENQVQDKATAEYIISIIENNYNPE